MPAASGRPVTPKVAASKLYPDVETGAAAATHAATHMASWITSSAALYAAIAVLVAASVTAIAVGVTQGIAKGSSVDGVVPPPPTTLALLVPPPPASQPPSPRLPPPLLAPSPAPASPPALPLLAPTPAPAPAPVPVHPPAPPSPSPSSPSPPSPSPPASSPPSITPPAPLPPSPEAVPLPAPAPSPPFPVPAPQPAPSRAPVPVAALSAALTSPSSPAASTPFPVPAGSQVLWWDEFEGGSLDTGRWTLELEYPQGSLDANQMQVYTASENNVWVADGSLHIVAVKDGLGSYTSSRVNSRHSGSWFPGMQLPDGAMLGSVRVEAHIQVPQPGQGIWAAFWLSPPDFSYGDWPLSGEIDVMEGINSMAAITQGLHYGAQYPDNIVDATSISQTNGQPYSDGFHTYAVEWGRDSITMYIDGLETKRAVNRQLDAAAGWWTAAAPNASQAPFDIPFSVILNVAVGGSWPGSPDNSTSFPATMLVDHVRVTGQLE